MIPAFLWTSPCVACTDDDCDLDGCTRYRAAHRIVDAAGRLAATIGELELTAADRRRAAASLATAIGEALSLCAGRLDRESFLAACGLTPEVQP